MACKIYTADQLNPDGSPKDGAVGIDVTDTKAIQRLLLENIDKLTADDLKLKPKVEAPAAGPKKERSLFTRMRKEAEMTGRYTPEMLAKIDEAGRYYTKNNNKFSSNMADVLIDGAKNVEGGIEELWNDAIKLDLGSTEHDVDFAIKSMVISKIANYYNQIGQSETAAEKYAFMFKTGTRAGKFIQAFSAQSHPEALIAWEKIRIYEGKEAALDRENIGTGLSNREVIGNSADLINEAAEKAAKEVSDNKKVEAAANKAAEKKAKRESNAEYRKKISKNLTDAVALLNEKLGIKISPDDNIKANGMTVGSLIKIIADAAVAAKTVTETIEDAVDRVIKLLKENGFIPDSVNMGELKKSVGARMEQSEATRIAQQEKAARKQIKETLAEEYGITLRKLVRDYYLDTDTFKGTLIDRLTIEGNLTQAEAKEFAAIVAKEYDNLIADTKQKIADDVAKIVGKTDNEIAKSDHKKLMQQINVAITRGKVDKKDFPSIFADALGFISLTPEQDQKLSDLKDLLKMHPPATDKYYRELQKYTTFIDSLNYNSRSARIIGRIMKELFYTNLLSGPTTFATNVRGIIHTGSAVTISDALARKDPALFFKGYQVMFSSFKKGVPYFKQMMIDGFNSQYASEEAKKPITPFAALMATPWSEANILQLPAKAFMTGPVYMVRAFLATDAIFKSGFREYFATIKAYDELLLAGQDRRAKDFWDKVNNLTMNTKAHAAIYRAQAESEAAQYRANGISVEKNFVGIRMNELQQADRAADIQNYAELNAQRATLNNRPEGTMGIVYDALNQVQQKVPLAYTVIPFIKIAINMNDTWMSFSPYGFKRAKWGRGIGSDRNTQKSWNKYRMGMYDGASFRDDRKQYIVKAAIGTVALTYITTALLSMLDDDDDKKESSWWNIFDDVTANISDDPTLIYQAKIDKRHPRKPYTVYLKGGVEFTYKESPFAWMFSMMGYALDDKNYRPEEVKDKSKYKLTAEAFINSAVFIKESNFLEGFSGLAAFGGRYQDVSKSLPDKASKYMADYARNHVYPKFYEGIYKGEKTIVGGEERRPDKVEDVGFITSTTEKFCKNIPGLETTIDGRYYDALGNVIKTDAPQVFFFIPFIQQTAVNAMKTETASYQASSPQWDLIISSGGRTDWAVPYEDLNGNKLSGNDRNRLKVEIGRFVNSRVAEESEKLGKLTPENFQKALNIFAAEGSKSANKKLFGDTVKVGTPLPNATLDLIEDRTKRKAKDIEILPAKE
jgi:hypothetical protein